MDRKLTDLTKRYVEIVKGSKSASLDRKAGPSKYSQRLTRVENKKVKALAKKVTTKGSGSRNITKFARTGGSGGAAGAGLGRGSISPKKF